MPANLPPQYIELENQYRDEKDPKIRLELAQRMLREIPKHKGTDHLVGELKRKISKLKDQVEKPQKHGTTRHTAPDHIPREGAGQFALFGPPNAGKSSILAALTRAHVDVAEWPYATRKPIAGMATWENVQLQLVDTPSISQEYCEPYVFNIIRTADVGVLVMSLGDDDILSEYDYIVNRVHEGKVRLRNLVDPDPRIPTALEVPVAIVATGTDLPDAETRLALLSDVVGGKAAIWPVSVVTGEGLNGFLAGAYKMLGLIRVYTKAPGHEPDLSDPILLPIGGTVGEAARVIHKEIAEQLQFARIWGTSGFDGSRVTADHVVADGDVLEFHV
ncbi:MAG: 50S ribosome-binding GTPase [Candidatus Zixiibacteriota bacterium]